ncbi:DUF397 domain-containing protein [Streptomyces sp. BBFR2]|uniref:DUF397 domain-containing protein n=1 Tax=Streptomyces sp. BBFR2 TaxID=3372854 RepID=UPI0037DA12E0
MQSEITTPFQKSSHSAQNGDCVEVAHNSTNGRIIRDSKRPTGPRLAFNAASWYAFLQNLKEDGEACC